jgi:hypothetical protein
VKRWQPPTEQVVEAPKPRRWPAVLLLLGILAVAVAGVWILYRQLHPQRREQSAQAAGVRSEISGFGDSLDVVVSWRLLNPPGVPLPDSVRVEVGLGSGERSLSHLAPGTVRTDTMQIPAPAEGQTISGYSCVAAVHGDHLGQESCTPWQYVRPSASVPVAPPATKPKSARAGPPVARIVVQPSGQQVDPDVGGRCAAWQREHRGQSVWIETNRQAVPACTGPNGKPTVAQFCAFAVLADGRRIKTENSSNDAYCDRLFQAWSREQVT